MPERLRIVSSPFQEQRKVRHEIRKIPLQGVHHSSRDLATRKRQMALGRHDNKPMLLEGLGIVIELRIQQ